MAGTLAKLSSLVKSSKHQHEQTKNLEQNVFSGAAVATVGVGVGIAGIAIHQELIYETGADADFKQPTNPQDPLGIDEPVDPNMHFFHGMIEINRQVFHTLTFAGGVFTTAGTAVFAIANSIYQAYKNHEYIQKANQHLEEFIVNLELATLMVKIKKTGATTVTAENVLAFCKKQCMAKITSDTLTDGAVGTTSIASSIFSVGLLFPLIFPITSILTIVALGVGALVTGVAAYLNRRAMQAKLNTIADTDKIKKLCVQQVVLMNATMKKTQEMHFEEMAKNENHDDRISQTSVTLLVTTLVLRISALAKYAISLIGVIATAALSVAAYAKSALDAFINYRNRQKHISNIPKLIAQATLPWIDQKSYYFFGKTSLEKFINADKAGLIEKYNLPKEFAELSARDIIAELSDKQNIAVYNKFLLIRKDCIAQLMQQDFQKFCAEQTKNKTNLDEDSLLKNYLLQRVQNYIAKDVKSSGRSNTFKLAFSTGFAGYLIFPPLAAIFGAISFGIIVIGEVITQLIARAEVKKFKAATEDLLNKAWAGKNSGNHSDIKELANFIALIKPRTKVSTVIITKALGNTKHKTAINALKTNRQKCKKTKKISSTNLFRIQLSARFFKLTDKLKQRYTQPITPANSPRLV
ncbi:MAG: hypothetical protein V4501_05205 [Pseudomonadota bacterium]